MVVICGRKWGLIVSLTRLVHLGRIPKELRKKHQAVVRVDTAFIANTRPGIVVGDVFRKGVQAYLDNGFPGEWRLHHQGGPTGYAGRDYKATSEEKRAVQLPQAFAWNPSIRGTKSEDTIIALPDKTEIISNTPDWPMLTVEYGNLRWERPDILIL
jgi:Xaa-Pro aminopeptidase